MKRDGSTSRRQFMRTAGAVLGGLTVLGSTARGQAKTVKIGLIGCGRRGKGAVKSSLEGGNTLRYNVQVAALADYFRDRALRAGETFGVPPERCFGGGPPAIRVSWRPTSI